MFKNRKIRMIGIAVLLVAAVLVVLSAVRLPATTPVNLSWPPRPDYSFLAKGNKNSLTSNEAGLAQYHLSERGSIADRQSGMEIYFQSERVEVYPAKINEAGLDQYHRSEWGSGAAIQNGLEIYHQSEWHGK